jgi:hypothetical protein
MNASQLFADINTNALSEVAQAANHYYDEARGLTVRQQFFIYPDDTIVALNSRDGGYEVLTLKGDNEATFRSFHKAYFQ